MIMKTFIRKCSVQELPNLKTMGFKFDYITNEHDQALGVQCEKLSPEEFKDQFKRFYNLCREHITYYKLNPEPKKRGRKPIPKPNKIPKKRGRKPIKRLVLVATQGQVRSKSV